MQEDEGEEGHGVLCGGFSGASWAETLRMFMVQLFSSMRSYDGALVRFQRMIHTRLRASTRTRRVCRRDLISFSRGQVFLFHGYQTMTFCVCHSVVLYAR